MHPCAFLLAAALAAYTTCPLLASHRRLRRRAAWVSAPAGAAPGAPAAAAAPARWQCAGRAAASSGVSPVLGAGSIHTVAAGGGVEGQPILAPLCAAAAGPPHSLKNLSSCCLELDVCVGHLLLPANCTGPAALTHFLLHSIKQLDIVPWGSHLRECMPRTISLTWTGQARPEASSFDTDRALDNLLRWMLPA